MLVSEKYDIVYISLWCSTTEPNKQGNHDSCKHIVTVTSKKDKKKIQTSFVWVMDMPKTWFSFFF